MNRMHWYETRTALDPEAYIAGLRTALPLYPGNVTVVMVAVIGTTKSGRKRFTIRLEKDAE